MTFYTYEAMLQYIIDNCHDWRINRTGIPDIGTAGLTFEHDMSLGFPLVTTKQMGMNNIATELEFFLKGITDKKWLQDRKCKIWNEWGNPEKTEQKLQAWMAANPKATGEQIKLMRNTFADEERDLGPIYGWQWRHTGGVYVYDQARIDKDPTDNYDHANAGFDQVGNLVHKLHNNPDDRRMIVSAWHPEDIKNMALPPCHFAHQIVVRNGVLNLIWEQRSCDMFLGVPYNIASYGFLLLLYAKEGGFKPGKLIGHLNDAHIYENHIDQVKEQLTREPYPMPQMEIQDENWNGVLNWNAPQFVLINYVCHPRILGAVAR